jgi:hypothetical protein
MNTQIQLTENEVKFLKLCLNYSDEASQRNDNYSNGGRKEAAALFNGDGKAGGGLIASLIKKGMGGMDEEAKCFCLSQDGITAAFQN